MSGALVQMKQTRINNPANTSTVVHFSSEDCSVEESRVEQSGDRVHCPKMSIGEHGFVSLCYDTENNLFSLHSMH